MVFSTRCFRSVLLKLLALLLAVCVFAPVRADSGIRPISVGAEYAGEHIELSARFQFSLNPILEEALDNGLSLPFVYEFQLTRPRVYSWYRQVLDSFNPTAVLTYRLSYHALSRQYRINFGNFYRNFPSIDEALAALSVVRGWKVLVDTDIARNKDPFSGRIRLRLDISQLPKPFQLSTLGQNEWKLESSWVDVNGERGS